MQRVCFWGNWLFRKLRIHGPQDALAYLGIIAILVSAVLFDQKEQRSRNIEDYHLFNAKYSFEGSGELSFVKSDDKTVSGNVLARFTNEGDIPIYANIYSSPIVKVDVNGIKYPDNSIISYSSSGTSLNSNATGEVNYKISFRNIDNLSYTCGYLFYKINPLFNEFYKQKFIGIESEKYSSFQRRVLTIYWDGMSSEVASNRCNEDEKDNIELILKDLIDDKLYEAAAEIVFAYNSTHPTSYEIRWRDFPQLQAEKKRLFADDIGFWGLSR